MSWYFNEAIYEDMQSPPGFSFPTIEFKGFASSGDSGVACAREEKKRKGLIY